MGTCKRCYAFVDGSADLYTAMQKHMKNLPPEMKCTQEVYERRLGQCEACEKLQNGMCAYCGCFVILRASKKNQYCPYPKTPKW